MQKVVEFIKNAAEECRTIGVGRFKPVCPSKPDDLVLLQMAKLLDEIAVNLELKIKLQELIKAKGGE